ncbi:MAG: prepilin-type N-terminal cleavage/methylation domain-containing protein, partial [Candidatus Hydrogenedens sp.]|nr:prepilin-type N-terminal cleavage/methylation domain-containing protein [Candidatus Hydrogenedens sp.]
MRRKGFTLIELLVVI